MHEAGATWDAQTKLVEEEYAQGMGPRSSDAATKDVQIELKKEECAKSMEQAQTMLP